MDNKHDKWPRKTSYLPSQNLGEHIPAHVYGQSINLRRCGIGDVQQLLFKSQSYHFRSQIQEAVTTYLKNNQLLSLGVALQT